MHEKLITFGLITILIGFFLVVVGTVLALKSKTRAEGGFIFWIGPFPIIGATSKAMFYALLIISVIFLLLLAILNLIGR
jgi:uncharacterized membrane protein